ncbi:ABC transporter permease subunit [Mycoplasma sp. Pen4]|uniref:ABC transporter permease n=1 Tax=Mycoplasma sp. Pen4 TaxID=640330 RepID=UPI0016540B96|nr:ABC transporter permease subunit [Mycoplasma sp. Pen4]QNM93820.1 ABC transporter permease subunit [Mycoplasma sp. Pen4]
MSRLSSFLRKSYIYIILAIVYIPLITAAVLSFNTPTPKGQARTAWDKFTWENWAGLFQNERDQALVTTILLAIIVSFLVCVLSLITVYALYRQKNRTVRAVVSSTSNIPLINPDNITAIGLVLVFGLFFGVVQTNEEGFGRVVIAHTIMALPYGISLMLPRSEKFNSNFLEASQDLGYSKIRSWFKTYLVYMIPSIIMTVVVSSVLSFDDFIITRNVSNTQTLGTKLYEGSFEPWALVLGTIVLSLTIVANIIYTIVKKKKGN